VNNRKLAFKIFILIAIFTVAFTLILYSFQESERENIIPRSVEGEGYFTNAVQLLIDGQSPPEGSVWNSDHNIFWQRTDTYFILDLGGEFTVSGLLLQVDANDGYNIDYSLDGIDYIPLVQIRENHGDIASGMDTMSTIPGDPHFVLELEIEPVSARFIKLTAVTGDSQYALSEVQVFGERGAVPEPTETESKIIRPDSITAVGEFENDENLIIDGRIPFEESGWNETQTVFWEDPDVSFGIDLGQIYEITGIVIQVDSNDDYRIEYSVNGEDYVILTEILGSDGDVLDGMDTLSSIPEHPEYVEALEFFPLRARYLRIFAADGDNQFSLSEFQVFGYLPSP
jgi:hypothetical protein